MISSLANTTNLEELTIRNVENSDILITLPYCLTNTLNLKKLKLLRCNFNIMIMKLFSNVLKKLINLEDLQLISIYISIYKLECEINSSTIVVLSKGLKCLHNLKSLNISSIYIYI